MNTAAQPASPAALKNREPHVMNDARVALRAGVKMACRGNVTFTGAPGQVGIVWGVDVASGRAMVDFGMHGGGGALRGLVLLTDLEVMS